MFHYALCFIFYVVEVKYICYPLLCYSAKMSFAENVENNNKRPLSDKHQPQLR